MLDAAYNFARFLSRDAGTAQDIVHAAFLHCRRGSDAGRNGRARLLKIVRDCYRTWLTARRRTHRQNCGPAGKPLSVAVASSILRSDDDRGGAAGLADSDPGAVRLAIETMPRRLREVLVLREIEALSYREIAEVTSLQTSEIMSRLVRARRMLARSLDRGPSARSRSTRASYSAASSGLENPAASLTRSA
ncbi:sigma factor-like helix-turn-helix DNA-binding protein [Bradyrhizobium sp. NP1]|uniref:sigma factor-like helix-turn-helix DNA-binding protein n=1 Tax=Bradyrhizobium sp. NP1 TaxID=3049772 RepID=UPI0025A58312|nr:sigma factor-like helix-turn-helix DNA-binding protein [Bradyrhizobium sp. NP1]WJR82060.1 sigma factor-like helix-turn-helix DNA-binding protein [Bradyrhizobium sp. NP1]